MFNAGGFHTLKGGYGFQHVVNDINTCYPGGYVADQLGQLAFVFGGVNRGTGTYGYYEVNDRRITNKAGADIHSLFIQDNWTIGNRLTLNLGVRTEDEKVPTLPSRDHSRRPSTSTMKDKLAPRLGAAYDVLGDGRMKVFGSWGLYYDWTKYNLPRGSFGAETWCIYYRGARHARPRQPEPEQHARPRPVDRARQLPRSPRAVVRGRDRSGSQADAPVEHQRGLGVPDGPQQRAERCTTSTTICSRPSRTSASLDADGNEVYVIGNPGKGDRGVSRSPARRASSSSRSRTGTYDALELGLQPPLRAATTSSAPTTR